MRPGVIGIGDGPDIEKHRAWNMRAEIIIRWQRQHARHLVGCVDDFDFWIVETGGEPIGGDQRIVGGRHGTISFQHSSWPGLSRPSTFYFACCKDVDARDRPGHDAQGLAVIRSQPFAFFGSNFSTGPPASRQAANPPPMCATGFSPMSCAVLAASAERMPPAQ